MEWALFTDLVFGGKSVRGKEVSVHVLQGNVSVWQAGHQFVMLRGVSACVHVPNLLYELCLLSKL